VTPTSIRRWITQYSEYGKDAFPGKGNLRAEDDKIRKLMRDNIDLKEENKILKKHPNDTDEFFNDMVSKFQNVKVINANANAEDYMLF